MDGDTLTLLAALLGATFGAGASTAGSVAIQRSSRIRAIRASELRSQVPQIRRAAEAVTATLGRGAGPISLGHFVADLEAIEREALTAGWRDARRAAPLVALALQLWRLDQDVWEDTSLGRQPRMDTAEAIDLQLRLMVAVGGALDNYELWLRRHLLKPWWRRGDPPVPWPERYE